MTYPIGTPSAPAYGQWPVEADPGDRAVARDVFAAVLLIVGGGAGIAQLWVPWVGRTSGETGWVMFQALKLSIADGAGFATILGAYAILAAVVLGVALVLLGVLMLLPLDHRPPGVVALVAALIAVLCAVWWVFWHGGGGEIGSLFSQGWIGWYLFLCAGVVALVGAIKALVSST